MNATLTNEAAALAAELRKFAGDEQLRSDGSRARSISDGLRNRFIALRTTMYEQGMFDPILQRFDSYTVEQAPLSAIADRLADIAGDASGESP